MQKTITISTNRHGQTLADLRAKYWSDKPGTVFSRPNRAKIVSRLMLAQAHVMADAAQRGKNILRMYHAGPQAVAAMKREVKQHEDNARDALRKAYGA